MALRAAEWVNESILLHARRVPGCNAVQSRLDEFGRRVNSIAVSQIRQQLKKAYPTFEILDLRDDEYPPKAENVWVVDAVSGEQNYVRGINRYCTLIGCWISGALQHVAIADHVSQTSYYVSRKEKSYSPLGAMHVSDSHNLKESVVTTRQVDRSQRVFLERYCGYFREFGCFPLDLVALGCRQIDVFCAGGLTAFEADLTEIFSRSFGAVAGDWSGQADLRKSGELLCSNSQLFKQLVRLAHSNTSK